jgi:hypothetical protein
MVRIRFGTAIPAVELAALPIKITESVRADRLRRPLIPSVTKDAEVKGFALHVTGKRAFYAVTYQPHGLNPARRRNKVRAW